MRASGGPVRSMGGRPRETRLRRSKGTPPCLADRQRRQSHTSVGNAVRVRNSARRGTRAAVSEGLRREASETSVGAKSAAGDVPVHVKAMADLD